MHDIKKIPKVPSSNKLISTIWKFCIISWLRKVLEKIFGFTFSVWFLIKIFFTFIQYANVLQFFISCIHNALQIWVVDQLVLLQILYEFSQCWCYRWKVHYPKWCFTVNSWILCNDYFSLLDSWLISSQSTNFCIDFITVTNSFGLWCRN